MSRQRKITPEFLAMCEQEAERRAQRRSNKQLARLSGGLSPKYVGNIIADLRRRYEQSCKHERIHVSC